MLINRVEVDGYENVFKFLDDDFHAFIAVHSTRLGPSLGGCRVFSYQTDEDALQDVLRLAKGMTYKNSLAGLSFGGGKAVINAPKTTHEMMVKFGHAVNELHGSYIAAEDVGTTIVDLAIAEEYTPYVSAMIDPSPWTALGLFYCIQSAVNSIDHLLHSSRALHIWVQGLGKVGWALTEHLYNDGYVLHVSDLNTDRVQAACDQFGAYPYDPSDEMDVYAPCAMGQVITSDNVDSFKMPIICGSANNQLIDDGLADRLMSNGILYCPDFLVNAGGVRSVANSFKGLSEKLIWKYTIALGEVLRNIIRMSVTAKTTPLAIANSLAEARLV